MIHAISGKPGGGKSLLSVRLLIQELRDTDRYIVTNLALKLPELAEYLHKKYGSTFDALQRITILDEEQMKKFWLYRGGALVLPDTERNDFTSANIKNVYTVVNSAGDVITKGGCGVVYFLDELHLFFNAREWMHTGKAALFYLSQHRKCGDAVYWITQFIENVDKQFRSVTQDYTYLRNHRKEKVFTVFASAPWISFATYLSPLTNTLTQQPTETGRFLIDIKGVASCYDTASGVGMMGRVTADTKVKPKGIPFWALWVGIIAIVPLCILLFKLMMFAVMYYASPHKLTIKQNETTNNNHSSSIASMFIPSAPMSVQPQPVKPPYVASHPDTVPVYCNGIAHVGRVWIVALSDGRVLDSSMPEVENITRTNVVVSGVSYSRIHSTGLVTRHDDYLSMNKPLNNQIVTHAQPNLQPHYTARFHLGDGTVYSRPLELLPPEPSQAETVPLPNTTPAEPENFSAKAGSVPTWGKPRIFNLNKMQGQLDN